MSYVGLHSQISRNNRRSAILLIAFPLLILVGVYAVIFFINGPEFRDDVIPMFLEVAPWTIVGVSIWFLIAYFVNAKMIQMATLAQPLQRKDNMRVYNITENLCMSVGMTMPKLYIIETDALNAFASGINEKSFAVTLTRGIIEQLDDDELEGVIAHELTHIRNHDVRLLIVTIVFVGIFGVILDIVFRSFLGGNRIKSRNNKDGGLVILVILLVSAILYFFSMIFKFALSRSREYMADAGAVELTKNASAMADALRKVAGHSQLKTTNNEVSELFLDNSNPQNKSFFASISNIFATHPPIEKRIQVLENL